MNRSKIPIKPNPSKQTGPPKQSSQSKLPSQSKRSKQPKQAKLLAELPKAYGGELLKKRKARAHGRPLATKQSMHFVLHSSQAKGAWSFHRHRPKIRSIVEKFAFKYGVKLNSLANVGNHLHLHLHLSNRHTYARFIRAITAAIMMAVTGASRWKKVTLPKKFWDRRPFSRVIVGLRSLLVLKDYLAINRLQGCGYTREAARFTVEWNRAGRQNSG